MKFVAEYAATKIIERITVTRDHIVAALLDPRFKKTKIVLDSVSAINETPVSLLKSYINTTNIVTNEDNSKLSSMFFDIFFFSYLLLVFHVFHFLVTRTQDRSDEPSLMDDEDEETVIFDVETEIISYMASFTTVKDPVEFWMANCKVYPNLGVLARDILGMS